MKCFLRIAFSEAQSPNSMILLHIRHLLEKHDAAHKIFDDVK